MAASYGKGTSTELAHLRSGLRNRSVGNTIRDRTRERWIRIPVVGTPDGSEQTTLQSLEAGTVIKDAALEVLVKETTGVTKTLDFGTAADPNGLMAAADVSTVGIRPIPLGALVLTEVLTDAAITLTAASNDWVEFKGNLMVKVLEPQGE